jgi:hypothetical protein
VSLALSHLLDNVTQFEAADLCLAGNKLGRCIAYQQPAHLDPEHEQEIVDLKNIRLIILICRESPDVPGGRTTYRQSQNRSRQPASAITHARKST